MSKLYVFGIGGTGSRVLKSLSMLLASGVKINASEIIPVIVDPDASSGDLTRTVSMLRNYEAIRSLFKFPEGKRNEFFRTKINMDIVPYLCMPIQNTQNVKFSEYIGLQQMTEGGKEDANYALTSLLFSEKNLNSKMDVGFKGNPNVGSVVLNQFQQSQTFIDILSSFQQGDRIFIISSIFGGTGASGFPLLIKNLRSANQAISGAAFARNAAIGSVTVLPYFGLKTNEDSEIDSTTFVSKTKAALSYYDKNMTESNVMYYLADSLIEQYNNCEGGPEQKNKAHFIEVAAALAIVDFMSIPDNLVQTVNSQPQGTIYKEFGLLSDNPQKIVFNDLSAQTNSQIRKPLTQFAFFAKYLIEQIESSKKQPWAVDLMFDDNFLQSDFFQNLKRYVVDARERLTEMSNNTRGFSPFRFDIESRNLFSMVQGVEPAKVVSMNSNYALYDTILNKEAKKVSMDLCPQERFVELFYRATARLVESKLRMA